MPTLRTVAIAPTNPGGYDAHYTTLTSGEAAEQALGSSLVALDRRLDFVLYAMTETSPVQLLGTTQDATRYIEVRPAPGVEAGPVWRSSGAYTIDLDGNSAAIFGVELAPFVRVRGIQLLRSHQIGANVTQGDTRFEGNFIRATTQATSSDGIRAHGGRQHIRNNVVVGWGGKGIDANAYADNNSWRRVQNNTLYNCNVGIVGRGGLSTTAMYIENNIAYGCTTGFSNLNTSNTANASPNASDDASGFQGSGNVTLTASPFVNAAGLDFTLVAGSQVQDVGEDLSAWFTTDMLGTVRPQGAAWDLGAHEYVAAGAPAEISAEGGGPLPSLTSASSATVDVTAAAGAAFPALQGSGAAVSDIAASAPGSFPALQGAGAAIGDITASSAGTLPAPQGSGTAGSDDVVSASGGGVLPALQGSGAVAVDVVGGGGAMLPALSGSGALSIQVQVVAVSALPRLGGSGGVVLEIVAAGGGALPALLGSGSYALDLPVGPLLIEITRTLVFTTEITRTLRFTREITRTLEF